LSWKLCEGDTYLLSKVSKFMFFLFCWGGAILGFELSFALARQTLYCPQRSQSLMQDIDVETKI
jgi:hypothetical protein